MADVKKAKCCTQELSCLHLNEHAGVSCPCSKYHESFHSVNTLNVQPEVTDVVYCIMAHKKFKSDHASKHYFQCASMFILFSLVTNLVCYRRL